MSGFERMFLEIQKCVVPLSMRFTESQTQESLRILRHFLEQKPGAIRFRLRLFFALIHIASFLQAGRSFSALNAEQKSRVLHKFFDSRIPLLRKGFWGLNTLARMGAYGQPSVYPEIHYRIKPPATPEQR